jgi:hypothetical protein
LQSDAMTDIVELKLALAAQENLRAALGDAVVDTTIAALREKLAALQAQPPGEQHKLLTVLFADVSGFTAMSEMLDAEAVRDTMNALWQRLDAAITSHGGVIDKHIGDAVMALWGVRAAREDDPACAIHAALAAGHPCFRWGNPCGCPAPSGCPGRARDSAPADAHRHQHRPGHAGQGGNDRRVHRDGRHGQPGEPPRTRRVHRRHPHLASANPSRPMWFNAPNRAPFAWRRAAWKASKRAPWAARPNCWRCKTPFATRWMPRTHKRAS